MCNCNRSHAEKPRAPKSAQTVTVVSSAVIKTYTNYSWYYAPKDKACPSFYQDSGEFPCDHGNKYDTPL